MLVDILKTLFERDLNRLKDEVDLYQNEKNMWIVENQIANSAGNLCLHLIGNLNSFIGAELGKTNYIRNRPLEFSLKGISKSILAEEIEKLKIVISTTLDTLTDEQLNDEYPILVFANKTSTGDFLAHLSTHLAYHLGQINYHRRILNKV